MDKILTLWAAVPLYGKVCAACAGVVALMFLEAAREKRQFEEENPDDYED